MASMTLTTSRFPSGTTVSVYLARDAKLGQAPSGATVTSAVASGTGVTFTGLSAATDYVAYALVSGEHRYVTFGNVSDAPVQYGVEARVDELESRADSVESSVVLDARQWIGVTASTSDKITQLQAAMDAARDAGPGSVLQMPPWFVVTSAPLVHREGVFLRSPHGERVSGLKLGDGSNADLLKTENWDTLVGTDSSAGLAKMGLSGLGFDGNKANNSSGGGVKVYAFGQLLENLDIYDAAGRGLWTEWSGSAVSPALPSGAVPPLESRYSKVSVHNCDGGGAYLNGAHDGTAEHIMAWRNLGAGIHIGPRGGALLIDKSHSWGSTQDYAWIFEGNGVITRQCVGEGAKYAQALVLGFASQIDMWLFCLTYGVQPQNVGFQIGQTAATGAAPAGAFAPSSYTVSGRVDKAVDAPVDYVNDGGNGEVNVNLYYESGHNGVAFRGTPGGSTITHVHYVDGRTTFPADNQAGPGIGISERTTVPQAAADRAWHLWDEDGVKGINWDGRAAQRKLQFLDGTNTLEMKQSGTTLTVPVLDRVITRKISAYPGVNAPTLAALDNGASIALAASEQAATDIRGVVDVTAVAVPATGRICRITFNLPNTGGRGVPVLQAFNAAAAAANLYVGANSTVDFDVYCSVAPAGGAVLKFAWHVIV